MTQDLSNIWRVYDQAIVTWLKTFIFQDLVYGLESNQTVNVRFAAMNKAFSENVALQSSKRIKTDLPEVAVTRIREEPDMTRNFRGVIPCYQEVTSTTVRQMKSQSFPVERPANCLPSRKW